MVEIILLLVILNGVWLGACYTAYRWGYKNGEEHACNIWKRKVRELEKSGK